jgi:hypothetical protein
MVKLLPLYFLATFLYSSSTNSRHHESKHEVFLGNLVDSSICNKTIKYIVRKIQPIVEGQPQRNTYIEITINPTLKLINLKSQNKKKEPVNFNTNILSFECTLDEKLTKGTAVYKGYTKQREGQGTTSTIKIEVKNGKILISESDPDNSRDASYNMIVDEWEAVLN